MESFKVDQEKRMLEVEKHVKKDDMNTRFWMLLADEFGPNIEAAFARVFDECYPSAKYRKIGIRNWENITHKAKSRKCGIELECST